MPVTLKFRTGWDRQHKNALTIARIAEQTGIAMLTLHGRTRADGYSGEAEYDTIALVKAALTIPVVANGDIDSPQKAKQVLTLTGADAVMIGRAAQGRPWIFREVAHYLSHGSELASPLVAEVKRLLLHHLQDHYSLYGKHLGVRSARKHITWYTHGLPNALAFRKSMNVIDDCDLQLLAVANYFDSLAQLSDRLEPIQHTSVLETST